MPRLRPRANSWRRAASRARSKSASAIRADEIVARAAAGNYDMIAMGTHGHTALANLVMGSVATRVVATSTVPVLLMK